MTNDGHEMAEAQGASSYNDRLQAAVDALTQAALASRPGADWAEFVTLALAGAAANVGGIEVALSGRPGSWEADGVRQLLVSTVGEDEAQLWRHRTAPVRITLFVDELLVERTSAWTEYEQAQAELGQRADAAVGADPEIDTTPYLWTYVPGEEGDWVPVDPAAPTWSPEAWRAQAMQEGMSAESVASLEAGLRPDAPLRPTAVYLDRSAEAGAEFRRLEQEREDRLYGPGSPGALDELLEEQRLREWASYGDALKARVEAAARSLELPVAVEVTTDVETFRRDRQSGDLDTLEERLVDQAVLDTPTPADLPGTPLERLSASPS